MRFKKWILVLALLGGLFAVPAPAADIVISKESRVPNRTDTGVCWWAAAETVGRQYGIKSLIGLTEKVVKDGRGFADGATDVTIPLWLKETGTKFSVNPHAKTEAGAKWVAEQLAAGKPVVACQNVIGKDGRTHLHAFLIYKFDYDAKRVLYVDCNDVANDKSMDYSEWYAWWYGRAYSFDLPAPGEAVKPAAPDAKPQTVPPPRVVVPGQGHIPIEHPVVGPTKPVTFPSNQDIKDGQRRPDDTLRYGLYRDVGGAGYDYYSDFKNGKKK